MNANVQSAFGLCIFIILCVGFCRTRRAINPILLAKSLLLQIALALLLLKVPGSHYFFEFLNRGIEALQAGTQAGTEFVFGYLGGGDLPFEETTAGGSFILALQVMPLVVVVSVLSALLIYWRILPFIMRCVSWVLERGLSIGGAVGIGVAANAFLGMIESPLIIKPYLEKLRRNELFTVMTAGMATISGTMLAIEASVISNVVPNAIGHLLSASLITLPAVVYVSHLLEPGNGEITDGRVKVDRGGYSVIDVISSSTQVGLQLFLNIIAMLMVVVALVHIANSVLSLAPNLFGEPISIQRILGLIMAPVTWLLGVPWAEAVQAGQLMGIKTVLTEFLAYIRLGELPADALSDRSRVLMTYALCGFANFTSLGIMITGLVVITPNRRDEIISLGLKSIVAGTIATCTTACIAGALL